MDWTFWVAGIVIVGLVVVTQVFLHESRWSRRPREEERPTDADRDAGSESGGSDADVESRRDDGTGADDREPGEPGR
ncbi:hypothetical protein [Agromyces sp. SYSU T00266]|uniref:hypothetical protein n=1 Tax=Agromyces zhanjiangensis TaxID=3158562 RepID=UPI003395C50F